MWSVPMMDVGDTRAVVSHSLDQEVEGSALRLIDRLTTHLKNRESVSEAEEARAVEELKRLRELTQRYEALLDDELTTARDQLAIAERQVRVLLVGVA